MGASTFAVVLLNSLAPWIELGITGLMIYGLGLIFFSMASGGAEFVKNGAKKISELRGNGGGSSSSGSSPSSKKREQREKEEKELEKEEEKEEKEEKKAKKNALKYTRELASLGAKVKSVYGNSGSHWENKEKIEVIIELFEKIRTLIKKKLIDKKSLGKIKKEYVLCVAAIKHYNTFGENEKIISDTDLKKILEKTFEIYQSIINKADNISKTNETQTDNLEIAIVNIINYLSKKLYDENVTNISNLRKVRTSIMKAISELEKVSGFQNTDSKINGDEFLIKVKNYFQKQIAPLIQQSTIKVLDTKDETDSINKIISLYKKLLNQENLEGLKKQNDELIESLLTHYNLYESGGDEDSAESSG